MYVDPNRAAQYVRMSTDMQEYSIENQAACIAAFATARGFTIVRSYEDAGRSGLRVVGRVALKTLLNDVKTGQADFAHLLVYDVSRWGRFQDVDESAYYEFICRSGGIAVHYCGEQFENDGTLTSAIIKNIKRAMAAEYSRELSVKVFLGQSQLCRKGFHVGSIAGYGLRRMLLNERGDRKFILGLGDRKSIKTERVILVPGPIDEIRTINYVYDLFLDQKKSLNSIARILNKEAIPNGYQRPWSHVAIRTLLSHEKYVGTSVYGRTSQKLKTKSKSVPPEQWIRGLDAFEPVVPKDRFELAQKQLKENASRFTDNEMLDHLTALWCREGDLRRSLFDANPIVPSVYTYKYRFGTLFNAYRFIGFRKSYIRNRAGNRDLRRALIQKICAGVADHGGHALLLSGGAVLRVNGELSLGVVIGRCRAEALHPFA